MFVVIGSKRLCLKCFSESKSESVRVYERYSIRLSFRDRFVLQAGIAFLLLSAVFLGSLQVYCVTHRKLLDKIWTR